MLGEGEQLRCYDGAKEAREGCLKIRPGAPGIILGAFASFLDLLRSPLGTFMAALGSLVKAQVCVLQCTNPPGRP